MRDGVVEIKREQEPSDHVVNAADFGHSSGISPHASHHRKADEVLIEHHELIRRMFDAIKSTPSEDPGPRDLLRALATELEIHEHIEDKLFYPAVQPVSEDVPTAHSEHWQMTDLLAITLKQNTATPEFDEHLNALHTAMDHHAGSEERSMFKEAQRLGDARLRELGFELESLMENER